MSFGYIALHCIGIVCTMFKKIQSVLHKPSHPANIGFFHKTSLALQSHNRNHHQILHFSFTNIHLVSNKTWVWPGRACDLVVGLWKWRRSTLTFKCVSSFCLTENNKFEQISPFPSMSPPEHLNKFEQIGLLHLTNHQGYIVVGYRGTFAFGRDMSDVKVVPLHSFFTLQILWSSWGKWQR